MKCWDGDDGDGEDLGDGVDGVDGGDDGCFLLFLEKTRGGVEEYHRGS